MPVHQGKLMQIPTSEMLLDRREARKIKVTKYFSLAQHSGWERLLINCQESGEGPHFPYFGVFQFMKSVKIWGA